MRTPFYAHSLSLTLLLSGGAQAQENVLVLIADDVDVDSVLPTGTQLDSVSLLPYLSDPHQPSLREWVYAERFNPNGPGPHSYYHRAVRGPRYKLIRRFTIGVEIELFYDLDSDPFELSNLIGQPVTSEERQAYLELSATLENISGP